MKKYYMFMNLQKIKDFLIGTTFPAVLIPIFMALVFVSNAENPQNPVPYMFIAGILVILVVWIILRGSLEQELNLINKYKLLMISLGELSRIGGNNNLIVVLLKHRDVDRKFNELYEELYKLIRFPYFLLKRNTVSLIEKKIVELVSDTKTLCEDFTEMENTENIHTNDCIIMIGKYRNFISKLNQPEFIEIKNTIPVNLLSPPLLPLYMYNPYRLGAH